MYMCVNDIDFGSFHDFSIRFWKCSDSVMFFVCLFVCLFFSSFFVLLYNYSNYIDISIYYPDFTMIKIRFSRVCIRVNRKVTTVC